MQSWATYTSPHDCYCTCQTGWQRAETLREGAAMIKGRWHSGCSARSRRPRPHPGQHAAGAWRGYEACWRRQQRRRSLHACHLPPVAEPQRLPEVAGACRSPPPAVRALSTCRWPTASSCLSFASVGLTKSNASKARLEIWPARRAGCRACSQRASKLSESVQRAGAVHSRLTLQAAVALWPCRACRAWRR